MLYSIITLMFACSANQLTQRGEAALERHDLVKAESLFREAIAKDPKQSAALVGLGWTYQLAGEKEAAAKVFERCLRFESENPDCLRGRASVALSLSEFEKARVWIEKAYALHPDHPGVLSSLALFRMNEGNLPRAKEIYSSLARRFPKKAEYLIGLAEIALRMGQATEAVAITDKALKLPDTPKRYTALTWMLRVRALISASAGREDPKNCKETAPIVDAWLKQAEDSLVEMEKIGVKPPEIPALKRQVLRRRAILEEKCPTKLWSEDNHN